MNHAQLRMRLTEEQATAAAENLSKPITKDAYGYGHACGFHAGLQHAIAILDDVHKRDTETDNRL